MSNAQAFFDLICGVGVQSADAMDEGHIPVEITGMPAAQMAGLPLVSIFGPNNTQFSVYSSNLAVRPASGPIVWPVIIIWEVRVGGRNYVTQRPLFSRKTMLTGPLDVRRGLVFSMQGPLFRQVLLSARVVTPVQPGIDQGAMVTTELDVHVNNSGNAGKLLVQVGEVIG